MSSVQRRSRSAALFHATRGQLPWGAVVIDSGERPVAVIETPEVRGEWCLGLHETTRRWAATSRSRPRKVPRTAIGMEVSC
jgi:hypothetical protein